MKMHFFSSIETQTIQRKAKHDVKKKINAKAYVKPSATLKTT